MAATYVDSTPATLKEAANLLTGGGGVEEVNEEPSLKRPKSTENSSERFVVMISIFCTSFKTVKLA